MMGIMDRVVPEHILERMHGSLKDNTPHAGEGFDAVFTLDEYQRLVAAERKSEHGVMRKEFRLK